MTKKIEHDSTPDQTQDQFVEHPLMSWLGQRKQQIRQWHANRDTVPVQRIAATNPPRVVQPRRKGK